MGRGSRFGPLTRPPTRGAAAPGVPDPQRPSTMPMEASMVEAHGRQSNDPVTPAPSPAVDRKSPAFVASSGEIGPGEQARLVAALREPSRHGPDCTRVDLLETHISYVLLTGKHAYKIKKAIALEFLDFRTLAARRFYCDEELRLNRRLAPALYECVVPITGSPDAPQLGGDRCGAGLRGPHAGVPAADAPVRDARPAGGRRAAHRRARRRGGPLSRQHRRCGRPRSPYGNAGGGSRARARQHRRVAGRLAGSGDRRRRSTRCGAGRSGRSRRYGAGSTRVGAKASCANATATSTSATSPWSTGGSRSSTASTSMRGCAGTT